MCDSGPVVHPFGEVVATFVLSAILEPLAEFIAKRAVPRIEAPVVVFLTRRIERARRKVSIFVDIKILERDGTGLEFPFFEAPASDCRIQAHSVSPLSTEMESDTVGGPPRQTERPPSINQLRRVLKHDITAMSNWTSGGQWGSVRKERSHLPSRTKVNVFRTRSWFHRVAANLVRTKHQVTDLASGCILGNFANLYEKRCPYDFKGANPAQPNAGPCGKRASEHTDQLARHAPAPSTRSRHHTHR